MNHLAENTVNFPALQGPGFEAHLGLGDPHAQIQCKRWHRRVSAKWSFLLECFTEQMGFNEFSEVCYYKSKLLFWGFFLFPYILISLFVFGAYEMAGQFPLRTGHLRALKTSLTRHSISSSCWAGGTDLAVESVTTPEGIVQGRSCYKSKLTARSRERH